MTALSMNPIFVSALDFTRFWDPRWVVEEARKEGRTHFYVLASEEARQRTSEGRAVAATAKRHNLLSTYDRKRRVWNIQL